MKRILLYISIACAGAFALASCDKNLPPVFDDANAFVAFDSEAESINEAVIKPSGRIEAADTLRIPVTLASVKGLEQKVSFEIVDTVNTYYEEKDGNKIDKTAHEGKNFKLLTTSKTLSFNAENRTQYIEFEILYFDEYTGDLKFNINLKKPSEINLGAAKTCVVTVGDIDHPLTAILGEYDYTTTGTPYKSGQIMTFKKDENDDHMVWIDNLMMNSGWAGDDTMFYGNVDDDLTTITIPLGQQSEYKYGGSTPVTLYGLYGDWYDDSAYVLKTGSTQAKIIYKDGAVYSIEFAKDCGFYCLLEGLGYVGFCSPQIIAIKK